MDKNIDLSQYAPIISDKTIGQEIYERIKELDPLTNKVFVDLSSIKAMTTFCAKQIFGRLYVELTSSVFYNNVILKNVADDVKFSINYGVKSAVDDNHK